MRRYWDFYSSEVLPPFLVTQVVTLYNSPSRNPKRGGQVIHREESVVFKVFPQYFSNALPYSYWALISSGIPQGMGSTHSFGSWSWTHEAHQASFPIFILFSYPLHPIWFVAFVQGVNWGDGQHSPDGSIFMGRRIDIHERWQRWARMATVNTEWSVM